MEEVLGAIEEIERRRRSGCWRYSWSRRSSDEGATLDRRLAGGVGGDAMADATDPNSLRLLYVSLIYYYAHQTRLAHISVMAPCLPLTFDSHFPPTSNRRFNRHREHNGSSSELDTQLHHHTHHFASRNSLLISFFSLIHCSFASVFVISIRPKRTFLLLH
jgi:hypothetical protein